jgi:TRAP-type mannitol/chloroaromatic compound transport system permease large subunit
MLALLFTAYAMIRCWINPSLGPPLPESERPTDMLALWKEFFLGLVPPAVLVLSALGSIVFGLATPTEGAGCGALGALLLTAAYGRLTWRNFKDALVKTLEISVLILFLCAASNFFGAVFARLGTPNMITDALLALDVHPYVMLAIIMAVIFLLGWPLEWVPIVLIVVPFLLPLVDKLGFDKTWFGILVAVNLQTAWLSPPVAMSGLLPEGRGAGMGPGRHLQGDDAVHGAAVDRARAVRVFPQIVMWLPNYIYGK